MSRRDWILAILVAVLLPATLYFAHKAKKKPSERVEYVERVVYQHDTIEVLKPVEIIRERRVVDTMRIPVVDTLRIRDTMYMYLEREQRTYGDSTFRAVVSGYDPRLESMEIYRTTEYIYRTEKKRTHWGIGVGAGYGLSLDGHTVRLTPTLSFGLTYNIFSW